MAVSPTYKTALATAQDAAKINTASRPDLQSYGGRVHHRRVTYQMLATETANLIVKLCDLPKGARVLPHISSITPSIDAGTTCTVDIGAQGDMDCFADGVDLAAATAVPKLFTSPALPAALTSDLTIGDATLATETPADLGVYLTFATVNTLAAANLVIDLFYTLPE